MRPSPLFALLVVALATAVIAYGYLFTSDNDLSGMGSRSGSMNAGARDTRPARSGATRLLPKLERQSPLAIFQRA